MSDAPHRDRYDVVVVGSGLGGLTAAALLAKEGRTVLVAEQGDAPGGYAHSFRRGPYTFDPAVHVFSEAHDGKLPDLLLRHLGVRNRCRFLPARLVYEVCLPGHRMGAPVGFEEFVEAHVEHFPRQASEIRKYFRLCERLQQEAHDLPPRLSLHELDAAAARFPLLFKYFKATVADVLDEHFTEPRVKAVCGSLWPYLGVPPSKLSFLTLATVTRILADGTFGCEGSFQNLADALAAALEEHGGELLMRQQVSQIVVDDGRIAGVILAGGERIRAPAVISNADARQTFEDLVGVEHLPRSFVRRLGRMRPSLSAFVVFAATTLDLDQLGAGLEMFLYQHWDHEETYRDIMSGRPGGMWGSVPTTVDATLSPPGEHLLIMTSLAPYDIGRPWNEHRERFADQILGAFEQLFPGLREHLTFVEHATPLTLERYCLNRGGAVYGWENTPAQTGSRRSPHRAPVPGLYLTGHWTQPGTGSLRVMVSGVHAAQMALMDAGGPGLSFLHADLPPA